MGTNKVPTLLIGLGGIGCSIAQTVSDMLTREEKQYIGVVGLDTNVEDLKALTIKYVQTSDTRTVQEYMIKHPEYEQWFPLNIFTAQRGMLTGAGQIRAISRLAALAAVEDGRFATLHREIKRILQHRAGINFDTFNLFLVGSITGGTGAGIFLQMPYYIRELLKGEFAINNIRTRGMFLSADLTKDVQPSTINKEAVMVNAYACMKELNAFYLTQSLPDIKNLLSLEYYHIEDNTEKADILREQMIKERMKSKYGFEPSILQNMEDVNKSVESLTHSGGTVPYDAFYLIEGTDNKGGIGNASLESVISQVGKMIYLILFTPLKAEAEGKQDNFVLQDMEGNGMNRYNSAGLCCLRYPYKEVLEYVTLQWTKDLVKQEWLYLDTRFEREKRSSFGRQKTDPSVRIPRIRDTYPELFEKETEGGEGKKLAFLHSEAFHEITTIGDNGIVVPTGEVCRADIIFDDIEADIAEIMEHPSIKSALENCELLENEFKKNDEGLRDELQRVANALDKLQTTVKEVVERQQFRIADDYFPADRESFNMIKDSNKNVYKLFSSVHPVVGRYFVYSIINKLDSKIEDLEAAALTTAQLQQYKKQTYGDKKIGDLNAVAAADAYAAMIIPVLNLRQGKMKAFKGNFRANTFTTIETMQKYCQDKVALSTYRLLKSRFEVLARFYEEFFNSLGNRIKINDERIEILEKSFMEDSIGEKIVYGSPKAFRDVYRKFSLKAEYELPAETKEAIAEGLFSLTFSQLSQPDDELTEAQRLEKEKTIAGRLEDLFDSGVVGELERLVKSTGRGIIDINIKQALEREYQLRDGYMEGEKNYEQNRIDYAREQVLGAMTMAAPMIAVNEKSDFSEIVYMGLNPVSAELKAGKPDKGTTQERIAPASVETEQLTPCVLLDEEFSPYEIICMKTKHNYMVEELAKYSADGDYAKAYEKRINSIDLEPLESGKDAFKTVVNPHLDRNWHEEAFLPPLGEEARIKSEMDVKKAFIYAMGWDSFVRMELEGGKKTWFYNSIIGPIPVQKVGTVIGNSYVDLLEALKFNRTLKISILNYSYRRIMNLLPTLDRERLHEIVRETELILDLVQPEEHWEENDENLLDIFISMYHKMEEAEWRKLFDALSEILIDYFRKIFDRDIRGINQAYQDTISELYMCSAIGKKEKQCMGDNELLSKRLTKAESAAKDQIKRILDKRIY